MVEPGAAGVVRLVEALRERTTITYDVNVRPAVTGTGPEVVEQVERLVALADLVKVSDEDLEVLLPMLGGRATPLAAAVARPSRRGADPREARGRPGGRSTSGRSTVAPRAVEVADTIGAGDTFAAALVDGLWRPRPARGPAARRCRTRACVGLLDHAARAAAVTVSRPGADPPYRSELG